MTTLTTSNSGLHAHTTSFFVVEGCEIKLDKMLHWGGAAKAAPSRKRRQRSPDYEEEGEGEGAWIHPQEGHAGAVAFDGPLLGRSAVSSPTQVVWHRPAGVAARGQAMRRQLYAGVLGGLGLKHTKFLYLFTV